MINIKFRLKVEEIKNKIKRIYFCLIKHPLLRLYSKIMHYRFYRKKMKIEKLASKLTYEKVAKLIVHHIIKKMIKNPLCGECFVYKSDNYNNILCYINSMENEILCKWRDNEEDTYLNTEIVICMLMHFLKEELEKYEKYIEVEIREQDEYNYRRLIIKLKNKNRRRL